MNDYHKLYEDVITGFLRDGFEIYHKSSWLTTMRRWKLVHQTEDMKVIESVVNIYLDNEAEPTTVMVRFAYYEKE
jgi:hypothetical protein